MLLSNMEYYITFVIAVRLIVGKPYMNYPEYLADRCLAVSRKGVHILLEKPLLSTILISFIVIILIITLFVIFDIIIITSCCILVIIIAEGAIIVVFAVFISIIIVVITLSIIMVTGLKIQIEQIIPNVRIE